MLISMEVRSDRMGLSRMESSMDMARLDRAAEMHISLVVA